MEQPIKPTDRVEIQPTIRWMGYDPATLSIGSHKKVWAICGGCGMAILREFRHAGRLCRRCVCKDIPRPNTREKMLGKRHHLYGKRRSQETRQKISESSKGKRHTDSSCRKISATLQGIPYDEWEEFAKDQPYCPKFNDSCREANRIKYDRRCFLSGATEAENGQRLAVHHIDMDKSQGCDGHTWKLVPLSKKYHSPAHTPVWRARIIYLLNTVWRNV